MSEIDGMMTGLLGRMLDVASEKQSLTAANIANVDTPGYSTRDIDFNAAMREATDRQRLAMEVTDPEHIGSEGRMAGAPAMFEFEPEGLTRRNDLNNVSIDREMLGLAKTAGVYSAGIELLRKRFALIRYALLDGRSGG